MQLLAQSRLSPNFHCGLINILMMAVDFVETCQNKRVLCFLNAKPMNVLLPCKSGEAKQKKKRHYLPDEQSGDHTAPINVTLCLHVLQNLLHAVACIVNVNQP